MKPNPSGVNGLEAAPHWPAGPPPVTGFTLEVTVPPNTTAMVWVPANDAASVTESGRQISAARGVKFLRAEAGAAVFEVASGSYTFRSGI